MLALASYPTYDPAAYYTDYNAILNTDGKPLLNRATGTPTPPAPPSSPAPPWRPWRPGAVSLTEKVNCPGLWYYPGTTDYTKCAVYPGRHGRLNITRALEVSCNCFFCEMGYRLGIDALDQYAAAFGLGQSTGIELGEDTGVLAGPEHSAAVNQMWYGGNTVQAAIGQSDHLFTPLQLASYIATLVRGGARYDAHLLKSVTAYDGSAILYEHEPEVLSQVEISASTLSAVKEGMYNLTTSGSLARYFKAVWSPPAPRPVPPRSTTTPPTTAFSSALPPMRTRRSPWPSSSSGAAAAAPWPPPLWRSSTPTSPTAISAPL